MRLVFDIGFNQGTFIKSVLKKYPRVQIVGIDGHPLFSKLLIQNLDVTQKVFLREAVVSNIHGTVSFCLGKEPGTSFIWPDLQHHVNLTGAGLLSEQYINMVRSLQDVIEVQSFTLDNVVSIYGHPDFIKLSIEGAEYLALEGLTKSKYRSTIINKDGTVSGVRPLIPEIAFEWQARTPNNMHVSKCLEHVKRLGYTEIACTSNQKTLESNLDYNSLEQMKIPTEGKGMFYVR